jgi:hypothetical protein
MRLRSALGMRPCSGLSSSGLFDSATGHLPTWLNAEVDCVSNVFAVRAGRPRRAIARVLVLRGSIGTSDEGGG